MSESSVRVMVVDDVPDAAETLALMLEPMDIASEWRMTARRPWP